MSLPAIRRLDTVARVVRTRTAPNGAGKIYTFRASTTAVARDGAVIPAGEWRLDAFRRNPVILLNHNADALPIGRAVRVTPDENGLMVDVQFDLSDPRGADVARRIDEGFLGAVSVGFRAARREYGGRGKPDVFRDVELLEISIVSVPADAGAVLAGRRLPARQEPNPARETLRLLRQYRAEVEGNPAKEALRLLRRYRAELEAERSIGPRPGSRRW
jgi:HK97 family phage prohead protease